VQKEFPFETKISQRGLMNIISITYDSRCEVMGWDF